MIPLRERKRCYLTSIVERQGHDLVGSFLVYRVEDEGKEWLELESESYHDSLRLELSDLAHDLAGPGVLRVSSGAIVCGVGTSEGDISRLRYVVANGGEPPQHPQPPSRWSALAR